jgi:CRP-like cAMP-binding protein
MDLHAYFNRFTTIDASTVELVQSRLRLKSFPKGTGLVAPGEIQREMYFISRGVQMSFVESDKKSIVLAFTFPPGLCAIPESFLFQKPAKGCLTCLTDSEVYAITFTDLQQLFDSSHTVERLFRTMTEVVLAGIITRHVELHTLSMEERFREFTKRSPALLQLVPHKYIASYLGIDPTNFSKLYNTIKI